MNVNGTLGSNLGLLLGLTGLNMYLSISQAMQDIKRKELIDNIASAMSKSIDMDEINSLTNLIILLRKAEDPNLNISYIDYLNIQQLLMSLQLAKSLNKALMWKSFLY